MNFISKVSQHLTDWLCEESQMAGAESLPDLQSLEDRVLYSAAPVPLEMFDAPSADVQLDQLDQQLDFISEAVEELQFQDASSTATNLQFDADEFFQEEAFGNEPQTAFDPLLELIVIDSSVEGYQALYDDVSQNYPADRIQVHVIDSSVDGVNEITRLLADAATNGQTFAAIHIVSHGENGAVELGNATLDNDSLSQYSDCLLYTSPSPRDKRQSRMPSSA